MANDPDIRAHITDLVAQEKDLRAKLARGEISADAERARLQALEVELDQYWDLLRQRDAKREFGDSPEDTGIRPPDVVERYEG